MDASTNLEPVQLIRYSDEHISLNGESLIIETTRYNIFDIVYYKNNDISYIKITPFRCDNSLSEEFSKEFSEEADLLESLAEMILADDDQNSFYNGIKKLVNSIIERIGY